MRRELHLGFNCANSSCEWCNHPPALAPHQPRWEWQTTYTRHGSTIDITGIIECVDIFQILDIRVAMGHSLSPNCMTREHLTVSNSKLKTGCGQHNYSGNVNSGRANSAATHVVAQGTDAPAASRLPGQTKVAPSALRWGKPCSFFTRCDSQLAGGTEATSIAPIHVRIAEARKRGCLRGMYLHLVVTTELPQLQDRDGAAPGYCPVSL